MELAALNRIGEVEWRIEPKGEMRVPVAIYADEDLIREMDDKVYQQAVNVATLPGVVATLRPTSNAWSSVIETRPCARSAMNSFMPSIRLAPPDSTASFIASGFVASEFAGLSASTTWRSRKPI